MSIPRRPLVALDPTRPEPDSLPGVQVTLPGHAEIVSGVAFSPDGKYLATASFDRTVKLWDAATGREVRTFAGPQGHQGLVLSVAFAPNGKTLASGGADNVARIWEAAREAPVANLPHPNLVDAVAYSPDGKFLATACHDGQLRIWDTAKNQAVQTVKASAAPQPNQQIEPLYGVAWSPDGKQIATGGNDRAVRVWSAADGKPVKEFKGYDEKAGPTGHRDGVFCLIFTPDGKQLISGSSDQSIKVWSLESGALVREFVNPALKADHPVAHPGWVHALRLLDGGKVLVSVGAAPRLRGSLAVWNVADGRLLSAREPATGVIYAEDAHGDRLALGCGPRDRQAPHCAALIVKLPR